MGKLSDVINKLATKIQRMDRRLKALERDKRMNERQEELEAYDASIDDNFAFRRFEIKTVEVTSIISDTQFLSSPLIPVSDSTTPFISDPNKTVKYTVDVPSGGSAPSVGNVVHINFTGTYGTVTPTPRFALVSAPGGSSAEYVVTEVHSSGNFLVCETTVASADGGANVFVALPVPFRKSHWNGSTINTVTYTDTSGDPQFRLATRSDSADLKQYERILPAYREGDIIIGLQLSHNTTVIATYTDGTTLVSNSVNIVDNGEGRAWIRIGEP